MSLKYGTRRRDFAVDFTEPWLFDKKLALSTGVYYRDIFFNSDLYDERHCGRTRSACASRSANTPSSRAATGSTSARSTTSTPTPRNRSQDEEGDYVDQHELFVEVHPRHSRQLHPAARGLQVHAPVLEYSGLGGDVKAYGFEIGGATYYTGPLDTIFSLEGIFRTIDTTSGERPDLPARVPRRRAQPARL